jgi:hypothetical protein
MLPRMTSRPALRSALVDEPRIDLPVWFLAECHRCGQDLAQPFRDETERDGWALDHAESTGHLVHLTAEWQDHPAAEPAPAHLAAMIRCFPGSVWRWLCPSAACAARKDGTPRWNGPYGTGQLALASWRAHGRTK